MSKKTKGINIPKQILYPVVVAMLFAGYQAWMRIEKIPEILEKLEEISHVLRDHEINEH